MREDVHSFLHEYRKQLALTVALAGAWVLGERISKHMGGLTAGIFAIYLIGTALVAYHQGQLDSHIEGLYERWPSVFSRLHQPKGPQAPTHDEEAAARVIGSQAVRIQELERELASERDVVAVITHAMSPDDFSS
jgi:hypothetical protein